MPLKPASAGLASLWGPSFLVTLGTIAGQIAAGHLAALCLILLSSLGPS